MTFPRACGDDPDVNTLDKAYKELFPAHAGMILNKGKTWDDFMPFPRACGDDPVTELNYNKRIIFSPRMRG